MKIKDFQFINSLDPTGLTYEQDIVKHFNINTLQSIDKVTEDIKSLIKINPVEIKKNYFYLNNKRWKIEKNFLLLSYEQFSRLDAILAENDNINNLHKLLSIYVRPCNIFGRIKPYSIKNQEKYYDELLNMDMNLAQGLMLFFFKKGNTYLRYINISYLNQMKLPSQVLTQNK